MSKGGRQTCVVGMGARTPVGLHAAATAAAVRAGISCIGEHPTMVDHAGDPFMVAMNQEFAVTGRIERMAQLATSALSEALSQLPGRRRSIQVFLALPEAGAWFTLRQAAQLCQQLKAAFPDDRLNIETFLEGNAAGMVALERAVAWLGSQPDSCCIVGGTDSLIDADVLETLDEAGHIASASHRWGFPPGEGAGMLALCDPGFAQRHQLWVLGTIASVATGVEPNRANTETICVGVGLADVMRRAALAVSEPITMQYCDMNGERYREHEFSYAALRVPAAAFVNAVEYVAPVDCWGHVGAATAPLLILLPLAHHARGASAGAWPMAWCGSENGRRGAAVLQLEGSP